jgi:hypothetical protein
VNLPYEIDNPPADPPAGVDPLLWKVAFALRAEHEPGLDGWCVAGICKGKSSLWPCGERKLADAGLMGSVGGGVQPPRLNERRAATRTQVIRPRWNER